MRKLISLVFTLAVLSGGLFFYVAETEGDGDMCVARANLMAAQIPPALDKLSAKHPLAIGLVRSMLNRDGALDDLLVDIIADTISQEDVDEERSQLTCAKDYVEIYLRREEIQDEIVYTIEQELGLES